MKKIAFVTVSFLSMVSLIGCGGAEGDNPGRAYMPDMYYSRAYEAYGYNNVGAEQDVYTDLYQRGINYNAMPVKGTVARGDAFAFPIPEGDSGYARAAAYPSPLGTMRISPAQMLEAERLYLIHCGICHGTNLDGNGPLWKGGDGPFPAAPRNLKDDYTKALSDGQICHVITYGKGQMGAYGSQVKPEQRWWIINYMRQKAGGAAATDSASVKTGAGTPATPASGGATGISSPNATATPVNATTNQ